MIVTGVIVRRRCMGKNLAFVDVQVVNNENNKIYTASTNNDDKSGHVVVKIAFRRISPSWDTARDESFPTKASELPFGACVSMDVRESQHHEKGPKLEVHTWEILGCDPKQLATEAATKEGTDGISCSAYLKARGDLFLSIHGQHPTTSEKKRPPTVLNNQPVVPRSSSTNEDESGHGDKRAKALRAKIFASWLIDTLGKACLVGGVLDIAGGKGQLSIELATAEQIPCTIIDPLVRKRGGNNFPTKELKRIQKSNGPVPCHVAKFFNTTDFLQRHDCGELVEASACLVGLHPDECTEDILDMALKVKKSVAIVPCCVFPSLFPARQLRNGTVVRTYEEFLQYLLQKDGRLKRATLAFEGKNQVIYYHYPPQESE